jgi:predicted O-methyltransferase YrrM
MTLKNLNDLEKLHETILQLRQSYQPPRHVMTKVNCEYTKYLESGGYYTWLALAVRLFKPKRILKLGNLHGASTIMMYSELTDETESFTSVDLIRDIAFVPDVIIADPRMVFKFGNDLNLSIYGDALPSQIDFLFIDTLHEYQQLQDEWKICQNLCRSGALVVMDDIHLNGMQKFWANITYPKFDITEDCHQSSFGAFIYLPDQEKQALTNDKLILQAYIEALDVAFRRSSHQSKPSLMKRSLNYAKSFRFQRHKSGQV